MSRSPAPLNSVLRVWLPIAAVLMVAALTLSQNSATRLYVWPWFGVAQLLFVLPLAYLLASCVSRRAIFSCGLWLDAGFVSLALGSVVCALCSHYRWQSVSLAAPYVYSVALTYGISSWLLHGDESQRVKAWRLFFQALGAFLVAVVLVGFAQWFFHDLQPLLARGEWRKLAGDRNAFPFGHSNYTAGFAVLAFPWLAGLAWRASGAARKFWALSALLALGLLASTGSRGGIAGALVAIIGFIGLSWWKGLLSRRGLFFVTGLATLGVILLVLHEPRLRNLIIHRRWDSLAAESNEQRASMAEAAQRMGRAHPFVGFGPGTIPWVYPKFRSQLSGGVEDVLQVHNTYLELWAEMGLIGVVALIFLAVGTFVLARRFLSRMAHREMDDREGFTSAAIIGLLSYAVMAATDHQLDLPVVGLLLAADFALPIALEIEWLQTKKSVPYTPRWALAILSAGLLVSQVVFAWPNARARHDFARALDAHAAHDQAAFFLASQAAVRRAPWDTTYVDEIAALLSEERAALADPAEKAALSVQIENCFHYSLRIEPDQEYVHFNLGWMDLEAGKPGALAHFARAAELVPDKGGVYLGMALALLAHGRAAEASAALALETLNDPAFLASPWWQTPEFAALKPATLHQLHLFFENLQGEFSGEKSRLRELAYSDALTRWLAGEARGFEVARTTDNAARINYFSQHPTAAELLASPALSYRRERTGYPVLMRHADFPPPRDLYVVRENASAARELAFLFPVKGWLPTMALAQIAARTLSSSSYGASSQ